MADFVDIRPGDTVLLQAEVLQTLLAGERGLSGDAQVKVLLYGKVDEHRIWVRLDHISAVTPRGSGLPAEPPDGTTLRTKGKVWWRADAEGYTGAIDDRFPDGNPRRFPRRWWDVAHQEWVDWPTVYERGGRPESVWPPAGEEEQG